MAAVQFDPRAERKIVFHRIDAGRDTSGAVAYDPLRTLAAITTALATEDRYVVQGDRVTVAIPDAMHPRPRLRLVNVRRTDLPQIEAAGVLLPLGIAPSEGIAEQIHVVFFPDNVIGSDFNFYGPRATRLADLARGLRIDPRIEVLPLIRRDVLIQLDQMQELTSATLRLGRGSIARLGGIDPSLQRTFESLSELDQRSEILVTIKRTPRSHESLTDRVRAIWRRMAGDPAFREEARALSVEGRNALTGEIEALDLLSSELVATRRIMRIDERHRVLDSGDAYAQIENAYDELREEIRRAGTIGEPT